MGPSEWRDMRQEFGRTVESSFSPLSDSHPKLLGVPIDDDGGQRRKTRTRHPHQGSHGPLRPLKGHHLSISRNERHLKATSDHKFRLAPFFALSPTRPHIRSTQRKAMICPDSVSNDFTRVAKAFQARHTGWNIHALLLQAFVTSNNLAIPIGHLPVTPLAQEPICEMPVPGASRLCLWV